MRFKALRILEIIFLVAGVGVGPAGKATIAALPQPGGDLNRNPQVSLDLRGRACRGLERMAGRPRRASAALW